MVGLDKDERDEFFKRENELTDQLAEKVHSMGLSMAMDHVDPLPACVGSFFGGVTESYHRNARRTRVRQGTRLVVIKGVPSAI